MAKKPKAPTEIASIRHKKDTRVNIPTEELRDGKAGEKEPELTLFSDFNGMEDAGFDKKVDFYHHDQHWSNRMILGDSLLVMTSLAEKEGLKGKVQTIYFDPPYGIKFGSNWQVSTRKRDVKDGKSETRRASPSRSARSATRGSSASTRTSRTFVIGLPLHANC